MRHTKARHLGSYILKLYNLKALVHEKIRSLLWKINQCVIAFIKKVFPKELSAEFHSVLCNEMALHLGAMLYLVADQ